MNLVADSVLFNAPAASISQLGDIYNATEKHGN